MGILSLTFESEPGRTSSAGTQETDRVVGGRNGRTGAGANAAKCCSSSEPALKLQPVTAVMSDAFQSRYRLSDCSTI